jgi:hypothetical protein
MLDQVMANEPSVELMLAFKCEDAVFGVAFSPYCDRPFVVGANQQADYRIFDESGPQVSLFVERRGPYLYVYAGQGEQPVKLNGYVIKAPIALPEHGWIELGGKVVMTRLFGRTIDTAREQIRRGFHRIDSTYLPVGCFPAANETARVAVPSEVLACDISRTRTVIPREHSSRSPSVNEQTTVHVRAVTLDEHIPTSIVPNKTVVVTSPSVLSSNEMLPAKGFGTIAIPNGTSGLAKGPSPIAEPQGPPGTVVVPTVSEEKARALINGQTPLQPFRVPEVSALKDHADDLLENERKSIQPASLEKPESFEKPESAKKVATAPIDSGDEEVPPNHGSNAVKPRWQAPTAEYSAVGLPVVLAPPVVKRDAKSSRSPGGSSVLKQLGEWARKRPIPVFAIALSSGLIFAVLGVMIAKSPVTRPEPKPNETRVTTTEVVLKTGVPLSSVSTVVENAPGPTVSKEATVLVLTPSIVTQPIVEKAIVHLVAGRHADALKSYEKLLEQAPDNEVVRTTVRILQARLASECDSKSGEQVKHCPEILP